ncbi:MAG: methylated-DNA--[protein]-cysteine S-methyltransferase [Chromatiales bacterium]|nr:methylated-DNA--[protein]-cysteine S-methyltransferase [Chromatiales bacterium]MDH4031913.1 methylated-DNA--[protein]-cysteine S-methyltransferase [Chromatiales bacterium]
MKSLVESEMRAALAKRDKAYDGRFYYGVVTTGVFCRPSCAARPARPENIRFFADDKAALIAGFRPCKRCRPVETPADLARLVETARHIEANAEEKLTLAALAQRVEVSPSRLQRTFSEAFGVSPKAYQDLIRRRRLKAALKSGDDVTGAIFAAGYGSTSRVYGRAARNLGMTPTSYRSGGMGEAIAYSCRNTALGPMMMAATDSGVCFVQFGDSPEALLKQLRAEFPKADLQKSTAQNSPELDSWVKALDEYLAGDAPRPDLPVDLRGTAFQVKVWRFLMSVEEGTVMSYGELASGIKKTGAARAVASACAANRIGVLVPCHRVLRGNGDLGGFRWGMERKRALLDMERARKTKRS